MLYKMPLKFMPNKTVAERVVERVDEALKADIMHWAALYVRDTSPLSDVMHQLIFEFKSAGSSHAQRE